MIHSTRLGRVNWIHFPFTICILAYLAEISFAATSPSSLSPHPLSQHDYHRLHPSLLQQLELQAQDWHPSDGSDDSAFVEASSHAELPHSKAKSLHATRAIKLPQLTPTTAVAFRAVAETAASLSHDGEDLSEDGESSTATLGERGKCMLAYTFQVETKQCMCPSGTAGKVRVSEADAPHFPTAAIDRRCCLALGLSPKCTIPCCFCLDTLLPYLHPNDCTSMQVLQQAAWWRQKRFAHQHVSRKVQELRDKLERAKREEEEKRKAEEAGFFKSLDMALDAFHPTPPPAAAAPVPAPKPAVIPAPVAVSKPQQPAAVAAPASFPKVFTPAPATKTNLTPVKPAPAVAKVAPIQPSVQIKKQVPPASVPPSTPRTVTAATPAAPAKVPGKTQSKSPSPPRASSFPQLPLKPARDLPPLPAMGRFDRQVKNDVESLFLASLRG